MSGEPRHELLGIPGGGGIPYHWQAAKRMSADSTGPLSELRWHEELEIKYFISGHAEIIVGADVIVAGPGDIAVVNPCQLHGTKPAYGSDPVYHLLMLPPDLQLAGIGDLFSRLLGGRLQFDSLIKGGDGLGECMEKLFAELEGKQPLYELRSAGYLSVLLGELALRHSHEAEFDSSGIVKYSDMIRPAVSEIGRNYYLEHDVTSLAGMCGLSTTHFSRIFKLVTGYSAVSYIRRIRVGKAMILLREMSVTDTAREVGYSDPAYFSRVFRSVAGMSPQQWITNESAENIAE